MGVGVGISRWSMDLIKRIKFREITIARICNFVARKINYVMIFVRYRLTSKARWQETSFAGAYEGQALLLVCNGPSLRENDLPAILNSYDGMKVMTMNRAYIAFDSLGLHPDFHVAINDLVLQQYHDALVGLSCHKFYKFGVSAMLDKDPSVSSLLVKENINDIFCTNIVDGVTSGGTVTYVCLQLAYYLGFQTVVIVGMDHKFEAKGIPNETEERKGADDGNHFHPNYFPAGSLWQLPDLQRSELAYERARGVFEAAERKILDCTVAGNCNIFEKVKV